MENKNENSRHLMFLEPVNSNSDVEELLNKLVFQLEALGINVTNKEEDNKDEG